MGCSVSTQSGVGGLYAMPNDDDEGIPYWLPTNNQNNSDVMEEDNNESAQQQQQYISSSHSTRRTSNTNRQKNQHIKKRPRGPSQQQQQDCCAAAQSETTAQWSANLCSNKITESPQRKPFPCTLAQAADDGVIDSVPCNLNEDTNPTSSSTSLLKPKSKLNHSPTIMDHPLAISTPQPQMHTHQIEEESPTIFTNRQWLVLPEQKYDMNTVHPSNVTAPFLGSMYWIPASPKQTSLGRKSIGGGLACQGSSDPSCLVYGMSGDSGVMDGKKNVPSLISPSNTIEDYSPMENISPTDGDDEGIISPFTKFGLQDMSMTSTPTENNIMDESSLGLRRAEKLLLSLNSTEEWDEEVDAGEDYDEDEANDTFETQDGVPQGSSFLHQENMTPQGETVDISRELLDYSELEESYVLDAVKSYQPPRQLFDNGGITHQAAAVHKVGESSLMDNMLDESYEVVTSTTPSKERRGLQNIDDVQKKETHPSANKTSKGKLSSLLCMAPTTHLLDSPVKVEKNGQETTRVVTPPCPPSPNVATFHTQGGSRRERHVSTLPSVNAGQPIRLRVTDKSSHRGASGLQASPSQQDSPCDYVSYDPYFSTGKYTITLPNGRPYGNGLVIKMGHGEFMILQDSRGAVLAVIKSRYTHTPSMVMYSPKKRFTNQLASGHRLTRRGETIVIVDGNDGEALYPWALISKGGRTMGDDCSVFMVNDNARAGGRKSTSSGIFNAEPSFRGRHEFDRELHTHTVVNRTTTSLEEVPCCVIVRDSSNLDAVDITIAPGKSALVLFYHVNGCAQYIILVIWLLHLTYICLCLTAFATHMN